MRRQRVVVIDKRDVLPGGHLQCSIAGFRDSASLALKSHFDSWILLCETLQDFSYFTVRGAIVGNAKLPVAQRLTPDRLDRGFQLRRTGVVNRHEDAEQR